MKKLLNLSYPKYICKLTDRKAYIEQIKKEINFIDDINFYRPEHILSVYILGSKIFYPIFSGYLLPLEKTGTNFVTFNLLWILISIYHDIGYSFQNNNKEFEGNTIELAYRGYVLDVDDKENKIWLNAYSVENLLNYYKINSVAPYEENERYEHGILGGYIFSKRFYKNPPAIYRNVKGWDYVVLAVTLTIAQHNIWPLWDSAKEENEKIVNRCEYDKKLIFKSKGLLVYILSFIDTIDPVKQFYDESGNLIVSYGILNTFLRSINFTIEEFEDKFITSIDFTKSFQMLSSINLSGVVDKIINSFSNVTKFIDIEVERKDAVFLINICKP